MENFPRQCWTYMELIKRRAAEFGDRVFCSFADGDELTFAEFETATNALASGLADLGVKKADRVLGMMYNSKAFLLTMIAAQKLCVGMSAHEAMTAYIRMMDLAAGRYDKKQSNMAKAAKKQSKFDNK